MKEINMDETTKEVAKATRKGLEVAEKVGGFLTTVLGDGCKELGGSFHDWTKFFRYKNILKLRDKVNQIRKERGIEGKSIPIPLSIGIPLIEAASLVEEETLQQKWAALIANATDPNNKEKIRKAYIDILSSMDSTDALILEWMGKNNELAEITIKSITQHLNLNESETRISISNLIRLGLLNLYVPTTVGKISVGLAHNETHLRLNFLGWSLLKICQEKA